jgi:hypothetical protein
MKATWFYNLFHCSCLENNCKHFEHSCMSAGLTALTWSDYYKVWYTSVLIIWSYFRKVKHSLLRCRGCYFCITRCEKCGGCISPEDRTEADLACSDFMCLDCWLTHAKCSSCNRPYCERHENLMVPLSMPGQFSCQRCAELDASLETQEDGY